MQDERKTPYRQERLNRTSQRKPRIPPSTKARWDFKLRVINWLNKLFPVSVVIVEDIKAKSKEGKPRWNKSFSPLQVGKNWFYDRIPDLVTKQGYETKALRDELKLKKTSNKLSKSFDAHCVDSWVLANSVVGGHTVPDNKEMIYLRPLRFHRRQLHVFVPAKGGIRKPYGSTRSMGLKRGSLVRHKDNVVYYVGGTYGGGVALHNMLGKRVKTRVKPKDCKFLCYNSWIVTCNVI